MGRVRVMMSGRSKFGYALLGAIFVGLAVTLSLLAKEQAYRRLFESDAYDLIAASPVPTVVCEGERITLWNPSIEFVTGKSAVEMIGRPTTDFIPDSLDQRHLIANQEVDTAPGFGRGVRFLYLPIETAFWGTQKSLVVVSHLRRHDGRVVKIARFEGLVLNSRIRWFDVTTNEYCRVKFTVEPELKPEPKPANDPPKKGVG